MPYVGFWESISNGFEEPFALSLFAGRVVKFSSNQEKNSTNRGFIGYLVSVGRWHILRNTFVPDEWAELEWKFKGTRNTTEQHLEWSFRMGMKFHSNADIANTIMLGLHRNRIDFLKSDDDFMQNLGIDYRVDMLQKNLSVSKQSLIIDKNWSISNQYALSLGLGVVWEGEQRYTGNLAGKRQTWSLIFRPNITF